MCYNRWFPGIAFHVSHLTLVCYEGDCFVQNGDVIGSRIATVYKDLFWLIDSEVNILLGVNHGPKRF